jgi:hypothetical protein
MRGLSAQIGLPTPLYDQRPTRTHDSRAWDSKVGVLVHRVVGVLAPVAQRSSPQTLRSSIAATVAATVTDRSMGRLDKARTRVSGMVSQYLSAFVPPPPTTFLGAEVSAGTGRVDLAWEHPSVGVFFDEIKTWRHVQPSLDEETWAQVQRYLAAGQETYGARFAGVRVLTLSHRQACVWISPQGMLQSLATSPLNPAALTTQDAA